MERFKVLDLNVIDTLHKLKDITKTAKIDNYLITVDSDRYENFYHHGFTCAHCGMKATYAAIERTQGSKKYHINVYGTRGDGKEVIFTKDHIFPKSMGGFDTIDNYQVLCASCNGRKGNKTNLSIDEAVSKGYTSYERANIMAKLAQEKEILSRLSKMVSARTKIIAQLTTQANLINPPVSKEEFR